MPRLRGPRVHGRVQGELHTAAGAQIELGLTEILSVSIIAPVVPSIRVSIGVSSSRVSGLLYQHARPDSNAEALKTGAS